ncbi:glycosyltransferase family 39 protein [Bdellovibrio sp. KM01]|uniref:ArnT family glycosyltransferase n=1 Tax=Bdellovibrio sp. KM01 TaxID=2748865 RepID=UPI0015E917E4|nr:glycosyltransferase family 39 protein [Bdellovibrio sp. KM01]QLY27060.1 glycosyltransferase family 39 protein [Bdellovibrio sp. KM01]
MSKNPFQNLAQIDSRIKWLAFALILFVFGKSWEPGVGLDSATYGSIALDILHNGTWFNPKLAPQIFDPFVEHPYLALWLDAFSLKLWGSTALGIHFTASVLGILGVIAFFCAIRRLIDENTALLATILLMTINVFMNFMSSGWLDMPMVAFMLIGFYFSSRISDGDDLIIVFLTGLFLSFAVLTKGAAAVGIFPILLFTASRCHWRWRPLLVLSVGLIAPIAAFSMAHYESQGFFFWKEYFHKQFVIHNDPREASPDSVGWTWYIQDAVSHAHLVALLFIPGLVMLWKRNFRWLAFVAAFEFLIHLAVYAFSIRQNRQYLLPIFPWFALAAGFLISLRWKLNAEKWSKGLFYLSVIYFFTVSVLPVTVHSMSGAEFYAFTSVIKNSPIKNVYFEVTEEEKATGELRSSYFTWYWQIVPVMFTTPELPRVILSLTNSDAILLALNGANNHYLQTPELVCAWNDAWILISTRENCSSVDRKFRKVPTN